VSSYQQIARRIRTHFSSVGSLPSASAFEPTNSASRSSRLPPTRISRPQASYKFNINRGHVFTLEQHKKLTKQCENTPVLSVNRPYRHTQRCSVFMKIVLFIEHILMLANLPPTMNSRKIRMCSILRII